MSSRTTALFPPDKDKASLPRRGIAPPLVSALVHTLLLGALFSLHPATIGIPSEGTREVTDHLVPPDLTRVLLVDPPAILVKTPVVARMTPLPKAPAPSAPDPPPPAISLTDFAAREPDRLPEPARGSTPPAPEPTLLSEPGPVGFDAPARSPVPRRAAQTGGGGFNLPVAVSIRLPMPPGGDESGRSGFDPGRDSTGGDENGGVGPGGQGGGSGGGGRDRRIGSTPSIVEPPKLLFPLPRPRYTDEARAHQTEGVVELEVVFTAAGRVEIRQVVRSLPYGLVEEARIAATTISYSPARLASGQLVDYPAHLNIRFQLIAGNN